MAWKFLRFGAAAALGASAVWAASRFGRIPGLAALGGVILLLGGIFWWLPRAAHRAFRRGEYRRAEWLYRLLRRCLPGPAVRASVEVSLAACALARDDTDGALEILARVEPAELNDAARAAWLNNRAYALARGSDDPQAALEDAEEAVSLRPDVAGFRHTRGVALLALGRLDEAIRELDAVWHEQEGSEATPLLEAERCYDLGRAWRRKGEGEYARDYFERAHRAAPDSVWARRAARELGGVPRDDRALAELV